MTIKVWCRVRSGVDHEVVEYEDKLGLKHAVQEILRGAGLYSGDRFIPYHEITHVEGL